MDEVPKGFEEAPEDVRELISRVLPIFKEYSMGCGLSICISIAGAILNSQHSPERELLSVAALQSLKKLLADEGPVKEAQDVAKELNDFLNKHGGKSE